MKAASKAPAQRAGGPHVTQAETEIRAAPPVRREALPRSADALDHYLGELANLPLLTARQELALAREIEARETECWRALLSYRPALDVLDAAVAAHLPERARKLEALRRLSRARGRRGLRGGTRDPRWARAATAAAEELCALDVRKEAANAAHDAVTAAFGADGRARAYLARVARAREAARRAKGRFVTANLRLVIALARRYGATMLPLADLIQEGNVGLMQAVERFDYRRGYRFSTYAAWWIRHALNRALSDKARVVRIPVHALDDMARVARVQHAHAAKTGAGLSTAQLAAELAVPEEKIEQLRASRNSTHPMSLDRPLGDEREQTLHDVLAAPQSIEPDQTLDLASWREELEHRLTELPEREATILRLRFGLDGAEELTLKEVGARYNLSRERIRQLQDEALGKLRAAIEGSRRSAGAKRRAAVKRRAA